MKVPYRLQSLLALRERDKRDRQDERQQIAHACDSAEQARAEALRRLDVFDRQTAQERTAAQGNALAFVDVRHFETARKLQREVLEQTLHERTRLVTELEAQLRAADQALLAAGQALLAIEKHRDKVEFEAQNEATRKQDEELDELAAVAASGRRNES